MMNCSPSPVANNLPLSGKIYSFHSSEQTSEAVFQVPLPDLFDRWVACFRPECCWMVPVSGTTVSEIPDETQMLLFRNGSEYILYLPLVHHLFRSSLFVNNSGELSIRIESGSQQIQNDRFDALYIDRGSDPYRLMKQAALDLESYTGTFESKSKKSRPAFFKKLGWCTWNAFYEKVSGEKVLQGLERFRRHQVRPGFVIVDMGWQKTDAQYLRGLSYQEEKFPQGMKAFTNQVKTDYGVSDLFLWQCYNGFWNGLGPEFEDRQRMDMVPPDRLLSKKMQEVAKKRADTVSGTFYPEHILHLPFYHPSSYERFYEEYHREMAKEGASGAKIDAISWIEACGEGEKGRVSLMMEFLRAAEKSSQTYFNGNMVWCSCNSNDFLFLQKSSGAVRSSMDFFPDRPESHGMHLYANAINSFYMGAFVNTDWDMFQSGLGAPSPFHAASRAISGGPVYFADEMGSENFEILQKLALEDGTIPLCVDEARPTLDTLFADYRKNLIKIFNQNACGFVLGVFNGAWSLDSDSLISGNCCPNDIPALPSSDEIFAVWDSRNATVLTCKNTAVFPIELKSYEFTIFTVSSIKNDFAPLGDPHFYNMGGVVLAWQIKGQTHHVELMATKRFVAYSAKKPSRIYSAAKEFEFVHEGTNVQVDLREFQGGTLSFDF